MTGTVLVVDDEKNIRRALRMVLEGAGLQVEDCPDAESALGLLAQREIDLIILDVRLPGMDGITALGKIRAMPETRHTPVLMISGHASVSDAMEAVKKGATDFFEKPVDRELVVSRVQNALRTRQLEREVKKLRADAEKRYEMVGDGAAMRALFAQIEKIAPTPGRVLVTGESGTGKELIARAIHRLSTRADKPFVKVNCAAIPAELIESELFGHERGAFTGAAQRKRGMFELADKGTLFLDEIGDMSPGAQAKVLRALQSGEITRVGSEGTVSIDVRVVAATNKDLETEVAEGRFREDLFFRLNVVPIHSPSLRERTPDIPQLAHAFLAAFCRENGMREKTFTPELLNALAERPWPGNVRELKNVVERMAILGGDPLGVADLPDAGRLAGSAVGDSEPPWMSPKVARAPGGARLTLKEFREESEKGYILEILEEVGWNISRAASELGVERTNLHKKIRHYGLKRESA
jgi:two-component system, NtrC family, nitrogen regulation response regulator NtrX